jgi:hypothetical protein
LERIVVTGDRGWADEQRVIDTLDSQLSYGEFLLAVGDCETGVDLARDPVPRPVAEEESCGWPDPEPFHDR